MKQSTLRLLLAAFVVAIIVAGSALLAWRLRPVDPFDGAAITDPPFVPLTYSIQTFLWWDAGQAGFHLDQIDRLLNFRVIKQTFPWREMEPRPGEWDFTQSDRIVESVAARDMQVVVRLGQVPEWAAAGEFIASNETHDTPPTDLSLWARYCETVAARYQGRVMAYQIWNEPNLSREWGSTAPDAAAYVELLAACSDAIRAADPAAILISAGLAPTGQDDALAQRDDLYLDKMYRAGFQQYIDVVGVHAPGFAPPTYGPDDAQADNRGRWASFRRVEDLRKVMLLHDDAARQMAILEFGYTTDQVNPDYAWFAVDEALQAEYTLAAYQYAAENWRPWVGLMNLIYMPDPRWTSANEESWWAVIDPDGRPRAVFHQLIGMDRYCGERVVAGWPQGLSEEDYLEQRDTCP